VVGWPQSWGAAGMRGSRTARGGAATGLAGVVLGMVLSGCSATASSDASERPSASPVRSAVADSFRSSRVHQTVAVPIRIRIPAAEVDTGLERLGRAPDGTIAVPSRAGRAGWYAEGPRPGQPGPAVIIGHVDSKHGPDVFFHLDRLRPDDAVYVDRADGTTVGFRVTGQTRVSKSHFPADQVYGPTLEPSLRLVTCGGSFDRATRSYRDNVIVFAVPT
jgi:sortase (surface protein transpeptidase)